MAKNLYVGNLPWSASEDDVRDAFAEFGEVLSVKLINDRENRSSSRLWLRGNGRCWCVGSR